MGVASYFEFVTTLFGWILYQGIWAVLVDTGIVFIPIIAMVLGHVLESHKGGDDEGSAAIQSLKKIEAVHPRHLDIKRQYIWVMLLDQISGSNGVRRNGDNFHVWL